MRFRRLKDERGQASLFMALFISTMILLFAFTTNVGMLVHAKINLQNAADAAAYAGAAVQARQLTSAAYLNYEMRRAVKEFLFYYQIYSQYLAMPCFPRNISGQGLGGCPNYSGESRHDFAFIDPRERTNESGGPYVPSVCVIFDTENNYCQKAGVPGIPEFQGGGSWGVADPIVAAVKDATNQIIRKKVEDCLGRTDINRQFLIAWLFNLYPFQDATSILTTGQDSADPFPFTSGFERLGILPRMAILRARIDNFEEMLNMNLVKEGFSRTITEDSVTQFANARTATRGLEYFERPIQAFLSAKNNLPGVGGDNGVFGNIELTELLPNQPGPADENRRSDRLRGGNNNPPILVQFNDVYARATFANSRFEERPGGDRGNCFQYRENRVIPRFPYGVTKDPNILTYYAVRLEAKARLLFSPFGGNGIVTLSAYSAAKPFGSRIGKDLAQRPDQWMLAQGRLSSGDSLGLSTTPRFPNVLVARDDLDSNNAGFARRSHLGYIHQAMRQFNRLDYGPRLAGAYAPWEIGLYTVPANYDRPVSMGLFEDNPNYRDGKFFYLAAPVFPVNGSIDPVFLRERVAQYLNGDLVDSLTLKNKFGVFLESVLSDDKWSALFGWMQGQGQIDSHAIPDPLLNDEPALKGYAQAVGARYTVAAWDDAQRRQLTSWNNQKTAQDGPELNVGPETELGIDIGRSGYSVKFVSFSNVREGGITSNDPEHTGVRWSNPFDRIDGGDTGGRILDDISKLKH